jgi:hypothetical protein
MTNIFDADSVNVQVLARSAGVQTGQFILNMQLTNFLTMSPIANFPSQNAYVNYGQSLSDIPNVI